MGVERGAGAWPPWIVIHGTYVVDRGLIVLFFGHFLVFFVAPLHPTNFSAATLA